MKSALHLFTYTVDGHKQTLGVDAETERTARRHMNNLPAAPYLGVKDNKSPEIAAEHLVWVHLPNTMSDPIHVFPYTFYRTEHQLWISAPSEAEAKRIQAAIAETNEYLGIFFDRGEVIKHRRPRPGSEDSAPKSEVPASTETVPAGA